MDDVDESHFSLMSLEDELTCSICLSPFDCPVTLPCGHNFCQDCLQAHWKDSYSCPQCRTLFPTKPELKKNTVLSTVVKTFTLRSNDGEDKQVTEETQEEDEKEDDVIRCDTLMCDTCMEAEASQTCLTCMASYCEEHLRPHRENPKFSFHQLCQPVGDLSEHICPDHNKLIEFFCSQHGRPICSLCLQQVHKGCPFISPEEQKIQKESNFRLKLGLLDNKIDKTETVLFQMKDMQSKLKDASATKKTALAGMYQQMRDILATEEREAQYEVDLELENSQTKLLDLMKKFTENAEKMRKAREDLGSLLSQSQSLAFLQASFDLPRVVNFEPHPPRINLDSMKVTATQAFAATLKEHLTEILKQPVEARLQTLKPDEKAMPVLGSKSTASATPEPDPPEQTRPPRSHSPDRPPIQPIYQPVPVPVYITQHVGWDQSQFAPSPGSHKDPHFNPGAKSYPQKAIKKKIESAVKEKKPNSKPVHKGIPMKDVKACNTSQNMKDKKSDSSHKPPHKQDKKPQGAHGGGKPGAPGGGKPGAPGGGKPGAPGGGKPGAPGGGKPGAPGGGKSGAKGSDSTKKDHPKGHPSSGKSSKGNPHHNNK